MIPSERVTVLPFIYFSTFSNTRLFSDSWDEAGDVPLKVFSLKDLSGFSFFISGLFAPGSWRFWHCMFTREDRGLKFAPYLSFPFFKGTGATVIPVKRILPSR